MHWSPTAGNIPTPEAIGRNGQIMVIRAKDGGAVRFPEAPTDALLSEAGSLWKDSDEPHLYQLP